MSVRGQGRFGSWFGAGSFGYSLLAVFLQVCCQFMPAACRTNSSQPGPRRIPVVHSYHVHVESSAFSQTGG